MNIDNLIAIDIHTHAEVSCRCPADDFGKELDEAALENSDIMIAFASIDPHKGKMGLREARRLIEDYKVGGFKFHPTVQGFFPNDPMAYPAFAYSQGQRGAAAGVEGCNRIER